MLEVHFADQPNILPRHYRSLGTTTAREEELIRFSHGPHSKLAMPTGAARYCLMNSGCAGQAAARQVNPNKRTPELEQTYLAIRHPPAG